MYSFVNSIGFECLREGVPKSERRARFSAMEAVRSLKDADFEEFVLKAEKPVLVDFYATWCGPCKLLSPLVDWAGREYKDSLEVYKVNIDEETEYVKMFNISALPHLVLFDNGKDKMHVTGLLKKGELAKQLEEQL
mmetsp:Transcript_9017/g.13146  ORF Transcript_9017/g.13146 Transcript_9017/m.13146 type:complete len:136 (-) Transcript_9017:173-580(-)